MRVCHFNMVKNDACNEDLDSWQSILEDRIERECYDSILLDLAFTKYRN
jgi:hypothetical protein